MDYALRAIGLCDFLHQSQNRVGWTIANQYLRASTSIGANMEEAQAGESRSDFVHKCAIALKEARESLYWLHLLQRSAIVAPNRILPLIQETNEIVSILTVIVVKTKRFRFPLSLFSILYSLF